LARIRVNGSERFGREGLDSGLVKNMDGKPFAGAQVKIERTDAKARAINTNADAKGNYVVNGLPAGTFNVAAYGKTYAKELGGVNTKNGSPVTVDLNLSTKSNNRLEKHYVWVKSELGSMIGGGKWVEADEAKGRGMNPILKMDREGARKEFEDLHGYNNPARHSKPAAE
jgi:Carboxypeptidase regulatory-like domain